MTIEEAVEECKIILSHLTKKMIEYSNSLCREPLLPEEQETLGRLRKENYSLELILSELTRLQKENERLQAMEKRAENKIALGEVLRGRVPGINLINIINAISNYLRGEK